MHRLYVFVGYCFGRCSVRKNACRDVVLSRLENNVIRLTVLSHCGIRIHRMTQSGSGDEAQLNHASDQ